LPFDFIDFILLIIFSRLLIERRLLLHLQEKWFLIRLTVTWKAESLVDDLLRHGKLNLWWIIYCGMES
jgi:hypothetical protein